MEAKTSHLEDTTCAKAPEQDGLFFSLSVLSLKALSDNTAKTTFRVSGTLFNTEC